MENISPKNVKKCCVVDVGQDMIMDFTEHLKCFFKTKFVGTNKTKFAISTYRLFQYKKGNNYIECSAFTGPPIFNKFTLQKFSTVLSLPTLKMNQTYPLPINELKVNDVKILVKKYVPVADQWYYKKIFGEPDLSDEPEIEELSADSKNCDSDSSFL